MLQFVGASTWLRFGGAFGKPTRGFGNGAVYAASAANRGHLHYGCPRRYGPVSFRLVPAGTEQKRRARVTEHVRADHTPRPAFFAAATAHTFPHQGDWRGLNQDEAELDVSTSPYPALQLGGALAKAQIDPRT